MPCVNVAHHRRAKASYKAARNEKVKARRQAKCAQREAKRLNKAAQRQAKLANHEAKRANKVAKSQAKANKAQAPVLQATTQPEVKTPDTKKTQVINPDDPQLLKDGAYIQIQPRDMRRHRLKLPTKTAAATPATVQTAARPAQNAATVQNAPMGAPVAQDVAPAEQSFSASSSPTIPRTPAATSRHAKQPNLRAELKRTAKRQAKSAKRQTKQALKAQQKAIKQQAKTAKLQLKVAKQQAKQLGYLPVAAPAVRLNLGTKQLRRRPSRAELINAESRLGSTLFGPIPAGHRREFFHDQQNVWIWHEGWVDQDRHARQLTVRYEVRPTGIYKKVSSGSYLRLEGHELENFRRATHAYLSLIKRNIYRYAPATPTPVA